MLKHCTKFGKWGVNFTIKGYLPNSVIVAKWIYINRLMPNGTTCSRIVKISFLKKKG